MEQAPNTLPEWLAGLVRNAGAGLVGWAIAKGWLTADLAHELAPVATAVVVAAWSWYQKRNKNKALNAAIAAPAGRAA